jgi:GH24 family phage-related lysozyme (muramidase)
MFGISDPNSPVDMDKLIASIQSHEGTGPMQNGQFMPYNDSLGNSTIGYGHLIANGVSYAAANQILSDDIAVSITQCEATDWWSHVSDCEPRARAVCELMFILGPTRFAGFRNAIAGLLADNFDVAANEIINSALDHEDGERINLLAEMIRTGQDPAT